MLAAVMDAPIRQLSPEEFAAVRAQGPEHTRQFVTEWIEQNKAAEELLALAQQLKDEEARNAIEKIIKAGTPSETQRLLTLLSKDKLTKAIKNQDMDEEQIQRKAAILASPTKSARAWRRELRKQVKQSVSYINLTLGLVGGKRGHRICTPFEKNMRDQQKAKWKEFGEATELTKDEKTFQLWVAMSSANKCRAAEIYRMTKGIEDRAKAEGKVWAFLTLTAPPRMHPNPSMGKKSWDGTTPTEARKWISDARARAEARLRTNHEILIAGVWTVEAQGDACPHEHLLVFVDPKDMDTVEAEFRKQQEWKSEAGMKFVRDNGTATAASYLFKYVLKSISSVESQDGETGENDAWRSTWSIRSIGFFGIPPISLWRNLRALESSPTEPLIAGLWEAANQGDAATYIKLAGGLNVKTKDRPVTSKKVSNPDDDHKTISFVITKTGDEISYPIKKWVAKAIIQGPKTGELGLIHNYQKELGIF